LQRITRGYMRFLVVSACLTLGGVSAEALPVEDEVTIEGEYLRMLIAPNEEGTIAEFGLKAAPGNYAGEAGLLEEGFGVASAYVPNRRLNEVLEIADEIADRPVLRYSYDCDGPNIDGLHVTRTMEPIPNEASLRVRWKIENKGNKRLWVAPWVRNAVAPGGTFGSGDRMDFPAVTGIEQADRTAYYVPSRNWIAATDPIEQTTIYGVFDADKTYSLLTLWDLDEKDCGFQVAYVPRVFAPGDVWETCYRINVVRGLKHVDFASDKIAVQLDYASGEIVLLISAVTPLKDIHIRASVMAENGRVWRLPAKRFNIDPNRVVRCTFKWTAPADGRYDFLAQLTQGGEEEIQLGRDIAAPHGGIDTQFVVGNPPKRRMEPWTDAPFTLERGPRTLKRTMACAGPSAVWIENGLEKIYPSDVPEPEGRVDPVARISLAQNERESFQVIIRPPENTDLFEVKFQPSDLVNRAAGTRIEASNIKAYNVEYCPVRIPSYFEGPTGPCPDPLPPLKPFTARGGVCNAVWFTVYAPPDTAPGSYAGALTLTYSGGRIDLSIQATVYDFELPVTPALKTDFGFSSEDALAMGKAMGSLLAPQELGARYVKNAFEHRVTLREPAAFPMPRAQGDYIKDLQAFEARMKQLEAQGATTFAVPPALLDDLDNLKKANACAAKNKRQNRIFCQIADEPPPPTWPHLVDRIRLWLDTAPDIPLMVTSFGLRPFLPKALGVWALHSQVFDTSKNAAIIDGIQAGKEVWLYVNQYPPRPYGNFLVDFEGIEHRILFWQTWALGMRGFHYWNINALETGRDPYEGLLDVTPVNGNGFLVYPGKDGPVNSIRWEIIRDGIEDYDYLAIFMGRVEKVRKLKGHEALIAKAMNVCSMQDIVPDLVSFSRDPSVLLNKREEIAKMIVELGKTL